MRTTRFSPRVLLLAGAMVFTAAIAVHGQSTPQPGPVDFAAVRKDLRNFITAQEVYFTNYNAYATAVGSLDFTPSEGVTIKLIETGLRAYSASGTIAGKSGASCVVFVGDVAAVPKTERGVAAKAEGRPMCDGDP
jgi:hypothetical protein